MAALKPLELSAEASSQRFFGCSSDHACAVVVVFTYFSSIICTINLTKYIYVEYGFRFPWFITSLHMALSGVVARAYCKVCMPQHHVLTLQQQRTKVVPLALSAALSIAAANAALVRLYPSFFEMLGCTLPIFTMVVSALLTGARYSRTQLIGISVIVAGGMLCSAGEKNLSMLGLLLWLCCMVFKAAKTTLQASMLHDEHLESVTLLMYAAPYELLVDLVGALIFEGLEPITALRAGMHTRLPLMLLVSCVITCTFNLASFWTIGRFSAVGFTIVGGLKTPADIVLSALLFRNPVTSLQLAGCSLMYCGAAIFSGMVSAKKLAALAKGPRVHHVHAV